MNKKRLKFHAEATPSYLTLPRISAGVYAGGIEDGVQHSLEVLVGIWSPGTDPVVAVGFSFRFGRRGEKFVPGWAWRG